MRSRLTLTGRTRDHGLGQAPARRGHEILGRCGQRRTCRRPGAGRTWQANRRCGARQGGHVALLVNAGCSTRLITDPEEMPCIGNHRQVIHTRGSGA
jgi:hypothetical protein